ncbi:beta-glucuronosyltransferase GlcAT14B isoform X2 [Gossypium hirsutum]|uniref:Beta-glucuronosyltransferase GlcAT14B isoform X2 n=1 Tax=Gossypium hirsutum TaxID=3635 RepID=A0ABM2YWL4_GOSHI|nr:beta-glucuronosyltransferase GlcAT14B-like isoform X2 [Gossypium hirsutum]
MPNCQPKWILSLAFGSIFPLFLLCFTTIASFNGVPLLLLYRFSAIGRSSYHFVENQLKPIPVSTHITISTPPSPPRFAYLISGSAGNDYKVFKEVGNVRMIMKANLVTYRGCTMVANTLHAAAIMLREGGNWDWFINLSASDYPLVTQDDLLHIFSYVPRDLNFIDHTSKMGWKAGQRAKPVIIDPALHNSKKAEVFWITQRRSIPTAFKLFTGSAWMALSRPFVDYCIWGWDNLPRKVLMYYTNFLSSPEGYFHTVICNAKAFSNTTVNNDLHFILWDNPPKQHPRRLTLSHMQRMLNSNAPFARKFHQNSRVLDKIDTDLLSRGEEMFTPGGWCVGSGENGTDPCSVVGTPTVLRPGPGAKRLQTLINSLLSNDNFRLRQCK